MEDPVLNRSLEETRELQTRWTQFRDFYVMAAKGQQKITAAAEMKFLELKSRIAMLHDGFMEKLQHDQKTGQNIMTIVGDCILLSRVSNASEAEKQKFEFDWNECYMLITEHLGALEEEKERLAGINENVYKAQKRKEEMQAAFHNFLHSTALKYSIILLVLFMILYGIPAFGIFPYTEFAKIAATRPLYNLVVNNVYRPYIDGDLEYLERSDIKTVVPEYPTDRILPATDKPLNDAFFKDVELAAMGVRPGSDARKTIDDLLTKATFETERFTAENQDMRFFFILFQTTEQAKQFVNTLAGVVKELNDQNRKAVTDVTHLHRSANLVLIGRGTHSFRIGYIQGKFKLKENSPNMLIQ